jgi:dTDP-4-dehydrorhamnose reductase
VHYSTDYVFDGTAEEPYSETSATNPISEYGRSKLAGENAIRESGAPHLIFRTSWIYGNRGQNFYLTMLRLSQSMERLRVVADQYGAPTWCRLVAEATTAVLATARASGSLSEALSARGGIYNLSCAGVATWHEFASSTITLASGRPDIPVDPISSAEYSTAAQRPKYSVLSQQRLIGEWGIELPSWHRGLGQCVAERRAWRAGEVGS